MAIAADKLSGGANHKGISDETLSAIRNLDVKQFAEVMGDVLSRSGKWYMTFRNGGERTPSLGIHPESNYWEDFTRSDAYGSDVLSYYAYRTYDDKSLKGERFIESVKAVCQLAGVPIYYKDGTVELPADGRKVGEAHIISDVDRFVDAKAEDEALDYFYRHLIDVLPLLAQHENHLVEVRGFSKKAIEARGYRSLFDNKSFRFLSTQNLISQAKREPDGVPGFIQAMGTNDKPYWTIVGRNGFLIPFRNLYNQIVGMQLRVDEPNRVVSRGRLKLSLNNGLVEAFSTDTGKMIWSGSRSELPKNFPEGSIHLEKSGKYVWLSTQRDLDRRILKGARIGHPRPIPIHAAVPSNVLDIWEPGGLLSNYMDTSVVWWGEGPAKGDVCADFTGNVHLQVAGVKNYELLFEPTLALGAQEVIIAFDADAQSKEKDVGETVLRCIEKARKELVPRGKKLTLAAWSEKQAKGLDDLMAGQGRRPLLFDL